MKIFYQPQDGVCGDAIPFYNTSRKTYEIYYLHDFRDLSIRGEGTDWRRLASDEPGVFREEGEMIVRGDAQSRDLFCYTGCVVEYEGTLHIFYTGHNYHLMESGGRKESVMHAVSTDGLHWEKKHELTFYAPEGCGIELNDWRDPYVYYCEEEKCWRMLLCTRKLTGPDRLRGATGLLRSDDLCHWSYCGSFWEPSDCWCPECPEIFKWGDRWYFIYSTFTEAEGLRTYYRISDSENGPWRAPAYNTFDSRAFYAGKTACDGEHRYIFGWNPSKTGDVDAGVWQWGGCLVTHELIRNDDGTLSVRMPDAFKGFFDEGSGMPFVPFLKELSDRSGQTVLSADSGFAAAMGEKIPEQCMITAEIMLEEGCQDAGLWLRADENGDEGYFLRLDHAHGVLAFDRIKRLCEHNEHERHVQIDTGVWHSLTVLVDKSALTAYLDGHTALSARMYDYTGSRMFITASEGTAVFRDLKIHRLVKGCVDE
ncbi:MAG: GH32 C-terminal domain-containing protein [Lachnospiraceae bacterium]|nr:GH32 C-terminal domain-containing protein [Lachnospiraceae bacterium]